MNLWEVVVRPVGRCEEHRYEELMDEHHYLGHVPKISETLWYIALWRKQWTALLSFSAAAWKCAARWIGWSSRHQYDRLKLVTNNSRFLILPNWHVPNLGSRILWLCQKRLRSDWQEIFGHPLVLVETFVDPERFHGTVYRAANWIYVGETKGFRRTRQGYSGKNHSTKMVFLKPLQFDARVLLSRPILEPPYRTGGVKIMINAEQMRSLPEFSPISPTPAAKDGVIDSPRCWPLQPGQPCVGCADTGPSRTGPIASAPRPASVSAADVKTAAMSFQATTSFAMSSFVWILCIWTALCNAGTKPMETKTKVSQSTARPCATP